MMMQNELCSRIESRKAMIRLSADQSFSRSAGTRIDWN